MSRSISFPHLLLNFLVHPFRRMYPFTSIPRTTKFQVVVELPKLSHSFGRYKQQFRSDLSSFADHPVWMAPCLFLGLQPKATLPFASELVTIIRPLKIRPRTRVPGWLCIFLPACGRSNSKPMARGVASPFCSSGYNRASALYESPHRSKVALVFARSLLLHKVP